MASIFFNLLIEQSNTYHYQQAFQSFQQAGRIAQTLMAGQQLTFGQFAYFPFYGGIKLAVGGQFKKQGFHIAQIKKIPLPFPLKIAAIAKPGAADAGYFIMRAVFSQRGRYLAPQAYHFALFFIDQNAMVWVAPLLKAFHLHA